MDETSMEVEQQAAELPPTTLASKPAKSRKQ